MPQGKASAAGPDANSVERSYPGKIADFVAFLLPFLLLAGLALAGGGFDLFPRHLSGILAWVLVAALLLVPMPEQARPGRSMALVGGLLLSLALWSGVSSLWSDSVSSSLAEFERGIGYLGFFIAAILTLRTPAQRQWFARGLGAGLAFITLLALGDRLLPGGDTGTPFAVTRLKFPLDYWNADGIAFGSALVLFIWFAATARCGRWRAISISVATVAGVCLYLTYSRGGLLVATIALLLLLFMSADRLRILGIALVTVASTALVVLVFDQYPVLSGAGEGDPATSESLVAAVAVLCGAALAVTASWFGQRWARRHPGLSERAVTASLNRRNLAAVAILLAASALVVTMVFGTSAWDQFSDSDIPAPADPKARFTELSGAWRYEFSQVAVEVFTENPVLGTGAGTYPYEWNQRREVAVVTRDAHSFYLESLSDLGVVGGLLTLGLAVSLIWLGTIAWRRQRGREAPVMLALTVALLLAFGFDWFWKLGATAAMLLLLAAWIVSAEAVDPARENRRLPAGLRLAGLAAAWVAIIVLAVPAAADRYIEASADSVRAGSIEKAADQARTASQLEPWAPEPHMQLATIAESRNQTGLALAEIDRAIELDPENWQARLLRFRINFDSGHRREAKPDYQRLRELNPLIFDSFTFAEVQKIAR